MRTIYFLSCNLNYVFLFLRLFASSCILLFASSQEAIAANKILSYDFNEGSGSTVINSGLANNANGTIEGASYLPDDPTGSDWVLNFNGVDSVEIPNYVNPSDLVTVEAWINPDEEDESVLFNNGLHIIWDDGYPGVRLALVHHQLQFTVAMTPSTGGINQIQVMGGITCSGHWQHVAGIYDGTSARIYINGKEIARNSNSTSSPGSGGIQNAYIGSNSLTSIFGFHGKIDDLHVWDGALTADELAAGQANTGECGGETNQPPVANAGIDQETEIDFGEANYANIILDGSGSFDPDLGPNPLSYHWTHIDSPDIIPESNSALTNFTITEPGIYSFSLVVNDGLAASSPDLVTYIIHESCESACSNTDSRCSINYLGCFSDCKNRDTSLTAKKHRTAHKQFQPTNTNNFIQTFRNVRDRLLASTPEGQRYIELYNNHTREILSLLLADPKLAETGITVLTELKPLFDKLLTGKGIETIISSKQLNTIDAFLNMLVNEGSPALQKDITDLRLKWGGFEQFAGKSIIDVQTKILGHGVFLPRLSNP